MATLANVAKTSYVERFTLKLSARHGSVNQLARFTSLSNHMKATCYFVQSNAPPDRQSVAMLCKSIEPECERHVSKSSNTEQQNSRS